MTRDDARGRFTQLHEANCFVLPNPWDVGSARWLASLGAKALATTSAGFAFSRGLPDTPTALSLDAVLAHTSDIVRATDLPVNADFQAGYGATPADVRQSVGRCIATGVAGLSIEDATGLGERPLFPLSEAVDRMRAAREAIDESGADVVLTGRAECFLVGVDEPLRDVITRLTAYAEAGADCLYAPGLRSEEDVREVVAAVAPKPVNVLARPNGWMTVERLAALGVRRVSVGSAMARVAWGAFNRAAKQVLETGRFETLADAEPFASLDRCFTSHAD